MGLKAVDSKTRVLRDNCSNHFIYKCDLAASKMLSLS